MAEKSLSEDLLGIPGVEDAEVDGSQDAPAGLRIRIAEGADQEAVGGAIRRVLDSYGLGTDTRLPGETDPVAREGEGVAVLTTSEQDIATDESDRREAVSDEQHPADEEKTVIDLIDQPEEAPPEVESESVVPPFIMPRAASDPLPSDDAARTVARIDSVSVEEGRSGIQVTVVASDGARVSQVASSTEGGVDSAVVKAAARLVDDTAPEPTVVDIVDRRVDGVDIVMIVLNVDGELKAGSAVVVAGRVFALGRATWAALAL